MCWSFTVLVYANIGSVKINIPCTLVVSLTVDTLDGIVVCSLFSTVVIFADLKKPHHITFSNFLETLEKTYSWK